MDDRRLPRQAILIAAVALAVAGCSTASPGASVEATPTATAASSLPVATPSAVASPSSATPAPSPSAAWVTCVNPHVGYAIDYPAGWYTTSIRPEEICTQFHPNEFTIPVGGEYPLTALMVHGSTDPQDAWPVESDPGMIVLLREDTTVNGRRAIRYEVRFTPEAMLGDGTMRYGYQVEWDGGVFEVASMADPGVPAADYAAWKTIVDDAVRSADLD
jgi:hypothetical protein